MSNHSSSKNDLIADIHQNGMKALQVVYREYREAFLAFGRKQHGLDEDILDVYQDAVIAFFENVIDGKITELKGSPKTYLFSIGKYMLIHKFKKNLRDTPTHLSDFELDQLVENSILETENLTHQQQFLATALQQLPGRCHQLLLLFYYRRFSIEAIRREMGYSNENSAKANKSRCMKSLREAVLKKNLRKEM